MNEESNKTAELLEKILSTYHEKNQSIINSIAQQVDENFSKLDVRLSNLDTRLSNIEEKLKVFSSDTSQNLEKVDSHLTSIQGELKKIRETTSYDEMALNLKIISGGRTE